MLLKSQNAVKSEKWKLKVTIFGQGHHAFAGIKKGGHTTVAIFIDSKGCRCMLYCITQIKNYKKKEKRNKRAENAKKSKNICEN